jgi:hypothetical protein
MIYIVRNTSKYRLIYRISAVHIFQLNSFMPPPRPKPEKYREPAPAVAASDIASEILVRFSLNWV